MILETAILNVRPGEQSAFEQAMAEASPLIAASPGFRGMEVRPCLEGGCRYLLLVWWVVRRLRLRNVSEAPVLVAGTASV